MKPRVGVSACLLGRAVRYDGRAKPHPWIRQELARHAHLEPFCPEVEAGLPVPRPPVELVVQGGELRLLGVRERHLDVTEPLDAWLAEVEPRLAGLRAVILKARSPSCGLGSVPVHDEEGRVLGLASGRFAAHLAERAPGLLLMEAEALDDERARARLLAHLRGD